MQILSHRGYWKTPEEKNLPVAFERSFSKGFGTETDLRDLSLRLVVSHDMPAPGCLSASEMMEIHSRHNRALPLALNVKADGLQAPIAALLADFEVENYFLFDMSIPDALISLAHGLKCFTRQSEHEPDPAFYEEACGVWVDGFQGDWWHEATIRRHLEHGKKVCLVSPELHKRPGLPAWERIAAWEIRQHPDFMLCTDFPEEAAELLR